MKPMETAIILAIYCIIELAGIAVYAACIHFSKVRYLHEEHGIGDDIHYKGPNMYESIIMFLPTLLFLYVILHTLMPERINFLNASMAVVITAVAIIPILATFNARATIRNKHKNISQ